MAIIYAQVHGMHRGTSAIVFLVGYDSHWPLPSHNPTSLSPSRLGVKSMIQFELERSKHVQAQPLPTAVVVAIAACSTCSKLDATHAKVAQITRHFSRE